MTGGGRCTRVSQWEIQAKANNGSIQVRADVFTLPASSWTWTLTDNGVKFAKGTAIANQERHDISYFELRRNVSDQQGTDTIRLVATMTVDGELCDGSVTL